MKEDKKIPILIIAPFFAPQTHAAMFRVHKLVKYLPEYGYKPIVITTDINYNYNEDLSLLNELSDDVEIHRVKYIEPTIRGLRMAFGGKDRTFKVMKNSLNNNILKASTNSTEVIKKDSFFRKLKSKIQHFLMNMPDAHWTWINPASKKANELIEKNNIKLFYTTCNPNSILKVGINIKKDHDIKWISDFRDPIGYIDRYRTPNKYFRRYDMEMIQKAMDKSDFITGTAISYGEIFKKLYGIKDDKYKFIPTGLDNKYIPSKDDHNSQEDYLLFSGEFLVEYGEYFFKVYNKLLENQKYANLKIYFIGRKEINQPMVLNLLNDFPKTIKNLIFIDHIPQLELYKLISKAKACLLIAGFDSRRYCLYAKMIDYIALKKPVISVIPKDSEAKVQLEKADLDISLTGDLEKDYAIVDEFLSSTYIFKTNDYQDIFLASSQIKSFVDIFNNLLGIKNDKK